MADDMEKTEEATPRKKERLHTEGSIPRSPDISTAAVLLVVTPVAAAVGDLLVGEVIEVSVRMFRLVDAHDPVTAVGRLYRALLLLGGPIMLMTLVAFAAGFAQSRRFTTAPLAFKLDRLNPIPNFKKIVPGPETGMELLKQVIKLLAVGLVAYRVVADVTPLFTLLPTAAVPVIATTVGSALKTLLLHAGLAFAVISLGDYLLAVRKFNQEAKMSKEELREERKQEDISPEVRQQRRKRMLDLGRGGAAAVREATVVVTNPTHFAVALRYDGERDDAPVVLAKGMDDVALEIRAEARRHQVPMVENRPLARALFASTKVGQTIPLDLYRAVAEVIAFVMQLRASRRVRAVRRGDA